MADRCSFEHLAEVKEAKEELVTPMCTEVIRFSYENLVSTREMRAYTHSPVTSAALMPFDPLPAFISQALPASQPSYELSGLLAKSPHEGDCEWQLLRVASLSNILGIEIHLPKPKTGVLPLVSRHSNIWAAAYCCLGIELEW